MLREMTLSKGREVIIIRARVLRAVTRRDKTQGSKEIAFVAVRGVSSWMQEEGENRFQCRRDFRFGRESRRHFLSNGFYFLNKI